MSLAYYFDQNVPRAIAIGLRRLGIDVLTSDEDGAADWPDERILERATALERIVFSCDADFLELAADLLTHGQPFAGVVHAHQLQITIGQAVRDLELIARVLTAEEIRNQVIHLPI
jgi:predicted nuclease of predicted toxin-antitoxin system